MSLLTRKDCLVKKIFQTKLSIRFPFRSGKWLVGRGGSTRENSHSWELLTQRYAYDLVQVDENGSSHANDGNDLNDYYCFNAEVISPADGEVVVLKDGVRDYPDLGDLSVDWRTTDFRGNHIVIKHSAQEFSFIAHIKKDSFKVRKGDSVKRGQVLGLCGNSGHSTEPHIHFHVQSKPSFWFGMGLPIEFSNYKKLNSGSTEMIQRAYLEKGEFVVNPDSVEEK